MALPVIPITGVDANYRVPAVLAEIVFNQGPATASAPTRNVVFVMPKLSSGTWTAATPYQVKNEADAITGAGSGSPLHRSIRMFLSANKDATVWAVPVTVTSGGSPATATATVTLVNAATGTGTVVVTIAGEDCSASFVSGASITTIGDALVSSINAKTHLPCTAVNAAGTITLTAKIAGASQGTASLAVHRVRASITSGVATTVSASAHLGAAVAGADGSTTEAANTLTALNAITARRFYYMVSSAVDATTLGHFKLHLSTKAEPRRGMRCVGIAAYPGTLANAQTLATTLNFPRLQVAWQRNPDSSPDEIAGNMAAIRQKREAVDSAANMAGYRDADWLIKPAYTTSDWPDDNDQNDAINDGLACIASDESGSYLVMSVNTKSKDSTGSVDDFRACETHRVSVPDEFVDELLINTRLKFGQKKLKNDEFLADGSVNPNQRRIRDVITPSQVGATVRSQITDYENNGKIQNGQTSKESLLVLKSPANGARVECGFDLNTIDHAHQFTFRIAEVSSG